MYGWPRAEPKPEGPGAVLFTSDSPPTNSAWLNLPGPKSAAGIALGIIETYKPHHRDKVLSPG